MSCDKQSDAGLSEHEEQYTDYDFDHRETEISGIPARWQDVERLLRTVFTNNDELTALLGENHAFMPGADDSIFAWLREVPWRGKRSMQDIERETCLSGVRLLEIVTESEEYRGGYRSLLRISLYRLGDSQTKLSIRSYSKAEPVVSLHERMVSDIRRTWLDAAQKETSPEENSRSNADPLTKRELAIAYLLATGLSSDEICNKLSIALDTEKRHRQNIARKWGLEGIERNAMVAEARRRGYEGG
jgi:DNA-binding CsgD family transcriptional regulator